MLYAKSIVYFVLASFFFFFFLTAKFRSRYILTDSVLGKGGFGTVYAGVRKSDGMKVNFSTCIWLTGTAEHDTIPVEHYILQKSHMYQMSVCIIKMTYLDCRCVDFIDLKATISN